MPQKPIVLNTTLEYFQNWLEQKTAWPSVLRVGTRLVTLQRATARPLGPGHIESSIDATWSQPARRRRSTSYGAEGLLRGCIVFRLDALGPSRVGLQPRLRYEPVRAYYHELLHDIAARWPRSVAHPRKSQAPSAPRKSQPNRREVAQARERKEARLEAATQRRKRLAKQAVRLYHEDPEPAWKKVGRKLGYSTRTLRMWRSEFDLN